MGGQATGCPVILSVMHWSGVIITSGEGYPVSTEITGLEPQWDWKNHHRWLSIFFFFSGYQTVAFLSLSLFQRDFL